jgi:predicted N-acetyltransferase YhbS
MILGFFRGATWDKNWGIVLAESEYVFRTIAKGDEDAVEGLVKSTFMHFLGDDYWKWKYLRNPNFDPSLVAVAEKKGKIVGCNHWLLRDIKLSSSLVGKAILCADIAVDPNHRDRGVGKSLLLLLRSSRPLSTKGAAVNYMFADPELSKRLYKPTVGYIPIPTSTVRYTKRWGWREYIRRLEETSMEIVPKGGFNGKGVKREFKVVFHVLGAHPLTIAVNQGGIEASEENVEDVDLTVKCDLATLVSLRRKEKRMRRFFKAWLTGKIKVKGSLFGIISLYRNLHLVQEIFR